MGLKAVPLHFGSGVELFDKAVTPHPCQNLRARVLALHLTRGERGKRMGTVAQIPTSFGHELRACLRCRLVKTYDQFRESGCENCPFFNMDKDQERVVDCTTPNFTGIISVMEPSRSWAARWLRIGRFVPGCYTLAVSEALPEEFQLICEEERVQYVPPKRL